MATAEHKQEQISLEYDSANTRSTKAMENIYDISPQLATKHIYRYQTYKSSQRIMQIILIQLYKDYH